MRRKSGYYTSQIELADEMYTLPPVLCCIVSYSADIYLAPRQISFHSIISAPSDIPP